MIFSESNVKIAAAFAKAWGEFQNPKHNATVKVKTKSGGEYTFDYTDFATILDEVKPILKDNGLSILQNAHTEDTEGRLTIAVETMLLHSSGEWMKSQPLRMSANLSIQDMGGQITYMKRYSLSAMLGIATEKDDDANGASGNDYQHSKNQTTNQPTGKLSEAQVSRLFAIAKSHNITTVQVKQALMKDYNKTQAADLTKQEYDELCKRLESAGKEQESA